jgi:hypothetical protein
MNGTIHSTRVMQIAGVADYLEKHHTSTAKKIDATCDTGCISKVLSAMKNELSYGLKPGWQLVRCVGESLVRRVCTYSLTQPPASLEKSTHSHAGQGLGSSGIDALICGMLQGVPTLRANADSKPFATFKVLVTGKSGESVLCRCITFSADVVHAVQGLTDGCDITLMGAVGLIREAGDDDGNQQALDVEVYRVLSVCAAGRWPGAEAHAPGH